MSEIRPNEYEGIAAALYDGGWRAGDTYELITEYGISEESAEKISLLLLAFDMEGRNRQQIVITGQN